jgi:hypothetical protein
VAGRPVRTLEAGADLCVGGLGEVVVELPDPEELGGCVQADEFVGDVAELRLPAGRRDGDGQDDPVGPLAAGDEARCACGGAGGDAVVDDHGRPAGERDRRPVAAVPAHPALQLGAFALLDLGEFRFGGPRLVEHGPVDDAHAVLADGPHPQLRLERNPQLAHHQDVQGCSEGPGDFGGDQDAAPRQADHDHVLRASTECVQPLGQESSGFGAVGEVHGPPPVRTWRSSPDPRYARIGGRARRSTGQRRHPAL